MGMERSIPLFCDGFDDSKLGGVAALQHFVFCAGLFTDVV